MNFNSIYHLKSFVKFLDSPFCRRVGLVRHPTTLPLLGCKKCTPGAHLTAAREHLIYERIDGEHLDNQARQISPWKRLWLIIWRNFNSPHPRMFCAKLCQWFCRIKFSYVGKRIAVLKTKLTYLTDWCYYLCILFWCIIKISFVVLFGVACKKKKSSNWPV